MSTVNMPVVFVQDSLKAFRNYELNKFDALVGENACQIRAGKITSLVNPVFMKKAMKYEQNPELYYSHPDPHISFLVESYVLTVAKNTKDKGHEQRDEAKYQKISKSSYPGSTLSNTQADKLMTELRSSLAKRSVQWVQSCATADSNSCLVEDKNAKIPTYPMMKVLLERQPWVLLKHRRYATQHQLAAHSESKTPIADSFCQVYGLDPDSLEEPEHTERQVKDLTRLDVPVMVIEGYCFNDEDSARLKRQISDFGLESVVLANAAAHPPCLPTHEKQAEEAHRMGCSRENPKLFCIDHIYPSMLDRELGTRT